METRNAEFFKLKVTGEWNGNPYTYEEKVPARDYQVSGWWMKFMSTEKKKAVEELNNAKVGQSFRYEWEGTLTEITAE